MVEGAEKNTAPNGISLQVGVVVLIAGVIFSVVWLYETALRDPRYLDGTLLAAGLGFQALLYFRRKSKGITPKKSAGMRQRHILTGWLLIAIFISHTRLSLPDTMIEWGLWAEFIAISLSGIMGTYLAWMVPARLGPHDPTSVGNVPARIAELAKKAHFLAKKGEQARSSSILPQAPYQIWIADIYDHRLRHFLAGLEPRLTHLTGSRKRVKTLVKELDALEPFVDDSGRERLKMLRDIVIEKGQLDYAYVNLQATRLWLYLHVPIAFALVILTIFHILVVCAYSAGT